jgi:hypothetical protein
LEELKQREGELAAVKERERKIRLELGEHATGLSLLDWAARREALAQPCATFEDFCLGMTLNYQRRTGLRLVTPYRGRNWTARAPSP